MKEGDKMAATAFVMSVEDARAVLAKLKAHFEEGAKLLAGIEAHVDDYLGHHRDDVTWGHVGDADRILFHLRQAAFAAGVGEEPSL